MAYNVLTGSGIKSIQRISHTISGVSATDTVTISAVDVNKTSINLLSSVGHAGSANTVMLTAKLVSSTSVEISNSLVYSGYIDVQFEVIEVY